MINRKREQEQKQNLIAIFRRCSIQSDQLALEFEEQTGQVQMEQDRKEYWPDIDEFDVVVTMTDHVATSRLHADWLANDSEVAAM